jgi:CheY-like chemotaxis protein
VAFPKCYANIFFSIAFFNNRNIVCVTGFELPTYIFRALEINIRVAGIYFAVQAGICSLVNQTTFSFSYKNMAEIKTILCVEDDVDTCMLLQYVLKDQGFEVVTCATSEKGLKLAREKDFSAIILDHRLADISGVEICRKIRTYDKQTPIIFYSASAFPKEREAGLTAGANEYLIKPNDFERIAETVSRLVR